MGDLVQRIRVLQGINRYDGGRVDLSTVPFEYLQDLIDAEILRQTAPQLGLEPTNQDIDEEVRARFTPALTGGQEADPGQLEREFRNNFQTFLTATGLTDGEFREIVGEELRERGLLFLMWDGVEGPMEHAEVQWIRLPVDPNQTGLGSVQPDQVSKRLQVEPFETVAREVSLSEGYAEQDGYVGWVPKGAFPELDPLIIRRSWSWKGCPESGRYQPGRLCYRRNLYHQETGWPGVERGWRPYEGQARNRAGAGLEGRCPAGGPGRRDGEDAFQQRAVRLGW